MTDKPVTPADPADFTQAVHYALRFGLNGKPLGKKLRDDPEWMAQHITAHLARANYVIMQGPPRLPHSTSDFSPNPGGLREE
jgi:hypothetical protein